MKKLTKLFLLVLCSGFLFLGFSNAQDLDEEDFYTDEYDNLDPEYDLGGWDTYTMSYEPDLFSGDGCHYQCGINLLGFAFQKLLILIGIVLGIMLFILYIKTLILCKKSDNILQDSLLLYIPILGLYPTFKKAIGTIRFFCLILALGFFVYSVYISINENKCCFHNPSRQEYFGVIIGIFSITILGILLSKLSNSTEHSQKVSGEESSDK